MVVLRGKKKAIRVQHANRLMIEHQRSQPVQDDLLVLTSGWKS